MVTISKIAASSAAGLSLNPLATEKVQRAEARQDVAVQESETRNPDIGSKAPDAANRGDSKDKSLLRQDAEKLAQQLQDVLDKAAQDHYHVGFRQEDESNSYIIEFRDAEGKLIKQFPQEKVLNLQRKMDELSGMVIDEMT